MINIYKHKLYGAFETDNDNNKTYIIQYTYSAFKHTFTQALKC